MVQRLPSITLYDAQTTALDRDQRIRDRGHERIVCGVMPGR